MFATALLKFIGVIEVEERSVSPLMISGVDLTISMVGAAVTLLGFSCGIVKFEPAIVAKRWRTADSRASEVVMEVSLSSNLAANPAT